MVHKLEIILNQDLICPWWIFKNCLILFLDFCQNFDVRTFSWWLSKWAYVEPSFFGEQSKKFFSLKMLTLVLLDEFLDCFSKFWLIIVKICILIWLFGVNFENYSMRTLSIRGNDFIADWAYVETISLHIVHTLNEFLHMLSVWWNFIIFYMDI